MASLRATLALIKHAGKRPPNQPRGPLMRMSETQSFGADPGQLRMLVYRPRDLPPAAPLVVTLHGCTQSGEGYAAGAGWLTLADRYGFAVLAPEQTPSNNPNLCFNWFNPGDVKRGEGEAASIASMIVQAVGDHNLDPAKIFVTGLSAGGAMTAAMLAAYPDVFSAGAVVAGLPSGSAANVPEAFAAMTATAPPRDAAQWGEAVRAASTHKGPWPKIAIWHGDADATVRVANAQNLVDQWIDVHGLAAEPDLKEAYAEHPRHIWTGPDGASVVESVTLIGMGHGTPLAVGGADGCGEAGPFLIEVGVSSSLEIARFFGIAGTRREAAPGQAPAAQTARPPVLTRILRALGLKN